MKNTKHFYFHEFKYSHWIETACDQDGTTQCIGYYYKTFLDFIKGKKHFVFFDGMNNRRIIRK